MQHGILAVWRHLGKQFAPRTSVRSLPSMRPWLEILEDRLTPAVLDTATPLMNQVLNPGQTSFLDLSANFIDSSTTIGTVVTFNTSQGSFNVTLFDKDAPQTVTNFLDYLQAGVYNSDVFHRLSNLSQVSPMNPPPTPFQVLQGGGFDATADASNNVTGFTTVSTFQPIQNESNDSLHPNALGTLSMARTSSPNSATSQFFFNLTDNSTALAGSNGNGFAVFGAVDSSGITALQNFASNYTPTDVTTATGNPNFIRLPEALASSPGRKWYEHLDELPQQRWDIQAIGSVHPRFGRIPPAFRHE